LTFLQPLLAGCDSAAAPTGRDSAAGEVRVASLVPAVTNILLELDQGKKLVAVSNYDSDERVASLPRVGDLLTIDWEQLSASRPTHMVIQMSEEKTPPGALQRAHDLGITPIHVKIERLDDIAATIDQLEEALVQKPAGEWKARFERELAQALAAPGASRQIDHAAGTTTRRGASHPTLIALSSNLTFVAGRMNYLDDVLNLAGGKNVVELGMAPYPTLDPEQLMGLRPKSIVLIMPNATEAQLAEARAAVASLQPQWGVGWESVTVLTDAYAMVPGWSVIEIARAFVERPAAVSRTSDGATQSVPGKP
jgi:ABC-type hemin transport system substrate-binding protein